MTDFILHLRFLQVTYNTLIRARSRYGSLHEVQQCLGIYQDMRKAGYVKSFFFFVYIYFFALSSSCLTITNFFYLTIHSAKTVSSQL